jgi:hypothetical protein
MKNSPFAPNFKNKPDSAFSSCGNERFTAKNYHFWGKTGTQQLYAYATLKSWL